MQEFWWTGVQTRGVRNQKGEREGSFFFEGGREIEE